MLQGKDRPVGISILAVLHFIGGIALIIALIGVAVTVKEDSRAADALRDLGAPVALLCAAFAFLAVVSFASAVGMWSGHRWGWYLGSFYYAYAITRNISALWNIDALFQAIPQEPGGMAHGISYYYMKFGVRLVISSLLYLYFFKDNVREYFGLRESRMWVPIGIQLFLCVDIALAIGVWTKYSR